MPCELRLKAKDFNMSNFKLWEFIKKLSNSLPDKEWAKVPEDASQNLDQYLISDDDFEGCDLERHIEEREAKEPGFKKLVEEAKQRHETSFDHYVDERMADGEFAIEYNKALQRIKKVDDFINGYLSSISPGVSIADDGKTLELYSQKGRFGVCFGDGISRDTYYYTRREPSFYSESGYLDCTDLKALIESL